MMGVSPSLGLLLCIVLIYHNISLPKAETVNITDGDVLKKYLCSRTLSPNTNLVLNKTQLDLPSDDGEDFCLLENTTNLSIAPSSEVVESHRLVIINCSASHSGLGLGFFNVTNLTIASVIFYDCNGRLPAGAVRYVNETNQFLYYEEKREVSLFFSHCYNLNLSNVSTDNYSGGNTGNGNGSVLGVNLCGNSVISTLVRDEETRYPLSTMLIYYTDSRLINVSSTIECNLAITSDGIATGSYYDPWIVNSFKEGRQKMPTLPFRDFALFMTQSFDVDVALDISPCNKSSPMSLNSNVYVVYVNTNSSNVTFQSSELCYLYCNINQSHDSASHVDTKKSLSLNVVFYETPQWPNLKSTTAGVTPTPLIIKDVSFANHNRHSNEVDNHNAMLQIFKVTGVLSQEVILENVAWCKNEMDLSIGFDPIGELVSALYARSFSNNGSGHLYLKLKNIILHHNSMLATSYLAKDISSSHVSFINVRDVTMSGTNLFCDNAGGTAINVVSSNLTIGGNLVINDSYAFKGGAIRLDGISTLYLKEPLIAKFYNNTAIYGSAIYAPLRAYIDDKSSPIQVVPAVKYSLDDITSINISLYFHNNSNRLFPRSLYAPQFSFLGCQNSPNLLFDADTWDSKYSQYAFTTLADAMLCMDDTDKYTSLSNGFCIQLTSQQDWNCSYLDKIINSSYDSEYHSQSQCNNDLIPYDTSVYPGQHAFSARRIPSQTYDPGFCSDTRLMPYKYQESFISANNDILSFTFQYDNTNNTGYYVVLLSHADVNVYSVPVLRLNKLDCPVGFILENGICICADELKKHSYKCDINNKSITSPSGYWTSFTNKSETETLQFDDHCHPYFCNTTRILHLGDDPALSCLGNRTGVLCGVCKDNYHMVFGNNACYSHCTNVYLLTLPVYAIAGVVLVVSLFVLRLTVATGTINGAIFYANVLGLVMDKLTERTYGNYEKFARAFIYLLNLNIGFPLCFHRGMTMAGRIGIQFLFPVYLWSIVLAIILSSHFSTKIAKVTPKSSVQVLATLFHLSFSKLLHIVIDIFSFSSITTITSENVTVNYMWFLNGQPYGHGSHGVLLSLAVFFSFLFLLPYVLFTTFAPYLMRFRAVNKLKPFIDAYGGPFKDKWRFWFGARLWITGFLFILYSTLEGTNSNVMFIVYLVVLFVFTVLQGLIRPFKNVLVGLLDISFAINYWLLIEAYLNVRTPAIFRGVYIFLTAAASFLILLVILFHIYALKRRGLLFRVLFSRRKSREYHIADVEHEDRSDQDDIDLFKAAQDRSFHVMDTY